MQISDTVRRVGCGLFLVLLAAQLVIVPWTHVGPEPDKRGRSRVTEYAPIFSRPQPLALVSFDHLFAQFIGTAGAGVGWLFFCHARRREESEES